MCACVYSHDHDNCAEQVILMHVIQSEHRRALGGKILIKCTREEYTYVDLIDEYIKPMPMHINVSTIYIYAFQYGSLVSRFSCVLNYGHRSIVKPRPFEATF